MRTLKIVLLSLLIFNDLKSHATLIRVGCEPLLLFQSNLPTPVQIIDQIFYHFPFHLRDVEDQDQTVEELIQGFNRAQAQRRTVLRNLSRTLSDGHPLKIGIERTLKSLRAEVSRASTRSYEKEIYDLMNRKNRRNGRLWRGHKIRDLAESSGAGLVMYRILDEMISASLGYLGELRVACRMTRLVSMNVHFSDWLDDFERVALRKLLPFQHFLTYEVDVIWRDPETDDLHWGEVKFGHGRIHKGDVSPKLPLMARAARRLSTTESRTRVFLFVLGRGGITEEAKSHLENEGVVVVTSLPQGSEEILSGPLLAPDTFKGRAAETDI